MKWRRVSRDRLLEEFDVDGDGLRRDGLQMQLLPSGDVSAVGGSKVLHMHFAGVRDIDNPAWDVAADIVGGYLEALRLEPLPGKCDIPVPDFNRPP